MIHLKHTQSIARHLMRSAICAPHASTSRCMAQATYHSHDYELHDDVLLADTQMQIEKPPLYVIIMHNDDYTPFDFVIDVLVDHLEHGYEQATLLASMIHNTGYAKVGLYPKEIAEAKVYIITQLAETLDYPLLLTFELHD